MNIKKLLTFSMIMTTLFTPMFDLQARVGNKDRDDDKPKARDNRANKGRGEKSRPQNINRTPSLSRAKQTRNRPNQTQPKEFSKPKLKEANKMQRQERREESRNRARRQFERSKQRKFDKDANNKRQRDFSDRHRERNRHWRSRRDHVRNEFRRRRPDHRHWFSRDFYARHNYNPYYYNRNVNWWRPARWTTVNNWLTWGAISPVYYEANYPIYLTQESMIYQDTKSDDDSVIYREPLYNEEVEGEWLPLGVFALGRDENQIVISDLFLQLSLNKEGEIAGTYYNGTTDETYLAEGIVDKETQQAVLSLTDKPDSIILSTGIYNLTQEQTEVTVTYPDGTEQTWILVRLEE